MHQLSFVLLFLITTSVHGGVTDLWSEETTGHWGDWGKKDVCPNKRPVYGFRLKSEENQGAADDVGLTGVQLYCRGGGSVTSTVAKWGKWLAASYCPGLNNPVVGFRIMIEGKRGWLRDDSAANRVELLCQRGGLLEAEAHTKWGKWSSLHKCPAGKVVVGIQTRVERERGLYRDDSAMNGISLLCHEQPAPRPVEVKSGTCTSVTKERCIQLAKERGREMKEIKHSRRAYPPGCYEKRKSVMFFNDKIMSKEPCSYTRVCLCTNSGNVESDDITQ